MPYSILIACRSNSPNTGYCTGKKLWGENKYYFNTGAAQFPPITSTGSPSEPSKMQQRSTLEIIVILNIN